jgi:hypothetical protein
MTGTGVDGALKQLAETGPAPQRVVAIGLLADRQAEGATPLLLACGAEKDRTVAQAAFKALETRADIADVPALIERIVDPPQRNTRAYAVTTLRTVLARAAQPEAGIAAVIESAESAKTDAQAALLSTLSAVGGRQALDYVTQQSQAKKKAVREAALRTLCEWSKYEAVTPLLAMVSDKGTETKYHVLGLRGIVRLIQQSKAVSLDQRSADCLAAMEAARRSDEKKLVIAALGTLPTVQAADQLLAQIESGELRNEAGLALLDLAKAMPRNERQAARKIAQKLVDLKLTEDITKQAQALLK